MRCLRRQLLAVILLAALPGGCASTPEPADVRDYLEEETGTSITYATEPAVFVNKQPGLASSGRDYVYLAPLLISSGGQRSCWLWLGVWSTIDRQVRDDGAEPLGLGALQIVADDEPMDLDLQSVDSRPVGVRRIPYATPVPPVQEFLVPVTRSQLRRLGRARVLMLTDRQAGGAPRIWRSDEHAVAVLRQLADETAVARSEPDPDTGR
jgi:hypothetical protein